MLSLNLIQLNHNYVKVLKRVLDDIKVSIPGISLYINCVGTYDATRKKWFLGTTATDDKIRSICSRTDDTGKQGFKYESKTINGANRWEVFDGLNLGSTSISGPCKCNCPADMTFTDANAISSTPFSKDAATNTQTFCCKDGYEFVPNAGYTYEKVATGTNGDKCTSIV
jgi:hypothetical protein